MIDLNLTPRELGMIMLCCDLGKADSAPLTTAQFRELSQRLGKADKPEEAFRDLREDDLLDLGYDRDYAARVLTLLDRQHRMDVFIRDCRWRGIRITTRISADYPKRVARLRQNAPPVLLYCGDLSMFDAPGVGLVGSRALEEPGRVFARRVGRIAAGENLILVSGGAAGADYEAQMACFENLGRMILFPADSLKERLYSFKSYVKRGLLLICAESSADAAFSAPRAWARNRLIHSTGDKVFVAQAAYKTGGTWSGTTENLRRGWTPVYANRDGGQGCQALARLGATLVDANYLQNYICSQVFLEPDQEQPLTGIQESLL